MTNLLPCPFCGRPVDEDLIDTLYPSGFGWLEEPDGYRHYVKHYEAPREQWCWTMSCPESAGGCGAQISGDSRDETIEKWNRRAVVSVP